MDDIEAVKRVQAGDSESFSLLVGKYHRHLLNFIYRLVCDEKIVEDIGQEVFFSLYRSIKSFDTSRGIPFSAWSRSKNSECCPRRKRRLNRRRAKKSGLWQSVQH